MDGIPQVHQRETFDNEVKQLSLVEGARERTGRANKLRGTRAISESYDLISRPVHNPTVKGTGDEVKERARPRFYNPFGEREGGGARNVSWISGTRSRSSSAISIPRPSCASLRYRALLFSPSPFTLTVTLRRDRAISENN